MRATIYARIFLLFISYWDTVAKKTKHKLEKQEAPKVAYNMPEPNDDLAAYGWHMNRLRYPSKTSTPDDIWPGASIFSVPEASEFRDKYGMDVSFVDPQYLQFMLDRVVAVQNAVLACQKKNYSPDSIKALRAAIIRSVHDVILPDIEQRVKKIATHIAAYYAARMAHVQKYGFDSD